MASNFMESSCKLEPHILSSPAVCLLIRSRFSTQTASSLKYKQCRGEQLSPGSSHRERVRVSSTSVHTAPIMCFAWGSVDRLGWPR